MSGTESEFLRYHELRLLRCSLPSPSSDTNRSLAPSLAPPSGTVGRLSSLIDSVISLIESGHYAEALSSEAARAVFERVNGCHDSLEADVFYSELDRAVELYLEDAGNYGALLVLSLAVAAFFAFVQCNVTGPVIELPPAPLSWVKFKDGASWEAWARNQLTSAGSDLLGKFSSLQFIVFAKTLIIKINDTLTGGRVHCGDMRSIRWWMFRCLFLQQRMLEDRCSSLFDLLQVCKVEILCHFGHKEDLTKYWGPMLDQEEASTIVSLIHLEAGFMEHTFGRVDSGREHFRSAELDVGLNLSLIGALGFRTIHQVDPKAQMLLVSNSGSLPEPTTAAPSAENGHSISDCAAQNGELSDVLITPRLVDNGGKHEDESFNVGGANLTGIQQMVILAQCLLIEKSSRQDELQRWEMAPYIESIDSQQSSYFTIRCFCNILRVRWESTRGRTRERSLLMLEKLVQGLHEPLPAVQQRIQYYFGVYVPPVPALRKEYGLLLVSQGLVGEALKIFEDLELWDNLIYCYRLLEKKAAAVELIKARLSETPSDPRLWCSLGDVTNDDACYQRALEVNDRCARAKRSLARSAYNKEDYETSKVLWESAMALNSLYPDGWFSLGSAALKARDIEKALDGFTRAVQLDPDNGEAWNNIACLHMLKKRNKESFIAFKEALKHKRNSWQMWENFSHVAADVGNLSQAIEAVQMVFDLSRGKRIEYEFLERLVSEMETRVSSQDSENLVADGTNTSEVAAQSRENDRLVNLLGKLLQLIVKTGADGDIWGLYARWHKMKGDLLMCSEALLKQVRSYQGADLWKDRDRFIKFAQASLELCKVYMEISSSTGSSRELRTAEMHLRNTIKQASTSFSDTQEFKLLQGCLVEVQARLLKNVRKLTNENNISVQIVH